MNIPGVHPTGPYHLNSGGFIGNVSHKISVGMARWHELLGAQPPDMVVLNAHLWDLARIFQYDSLYMIKHKASVFNILSDLLPSEAVEGYIRNLTLVVEQVRSLVPEVRGEAGLGAWPGRSCCCLALPLPAPRCT
jgi:hypothetical protein